MRACDLERCLSSNQGWSLGHAVDWLIGEGQQIIEPIEFTDQLSRALLESGVSLYTLRIAFETLHPLVAACAFTWSQEQNATEFCLLHTDSHANGLSDLNTDREMSANFVDSVSLHLESPTGKNNLLVLSTRADSGFSADDIAKFEVLANLLASKVSLIALRRITESLLDTYIGQRTGRKVLDGQVRRGDGESIDAVIWYCDLRDFTLLTETLSADDLLSLLNTYFEYVSDAVSRHGGEILRFIGDAMLIVFPVRTDPGIGSLCESVLDAVVDVMRNLDNFNRQHQAEGSPPLRFGVGLHVGTVIYGNVGAPDRLDFTVIGTAVNRAARLEALTKEAGHPLLMSDKFVENLKTPVQSLGKYAMRGVADLQEIFTLAPSHSGSTLTEGIERTIA